MYSVPLPVSAIRTRIRQEFERHRYVNKLPVVDVLIQKGNADYQVRYAAVKWAGTLKTRLGADFGFYYQETMNYWRQTTHVMSYFKEENFRGDKRLPNNFITGFLEVSSHSECRHRAPVFNTVPGTQLEQAAHPCSFLNVNNNQDPLKQTTFSLSIP